MDDLIIKIICTIPSVLWIGFLIWKCPPFHVFSLSLDAPMIAPNTKLKEEINKLGKELNNMGCTIDQMTEMTSTIDKLSSPLVYKGACDTLPSLDDLKLYEDGDVITIGDKQYLYDNDTWISIGDPEDVAY